MTSNLLKRLIILIVVFSITACVAPPVRDDEVDEVDDVDESSTEQVQSPSEPEEVVSDNSTRRLSEVVSHSWVNPGIASNDIGKVLVIAVLDDETQASQYEIELTAALMAENLHAIPRANILSLAGTPSKARVEWVLKNEQYDAVLVTRICPLNDGEIKQAKNTQFEVTGSRGQFGLYWDDSAQEKSFTRDIEKLSKLFVESSLFDTSDGSVMWRSRNETIDPQFTESPLEFIGTLTSKLSGDGLIP
jgi:hypothetical protein